MKLIVLLATTIAVAHCIRPIPLDLAADQIAQNVAACGDYGSPRYELIPLNECDTVTCDFPNSICRYNFDRDAFSCYPLRDSCQILLGYIPKTTTKLSLTTRQATAPPTPLWSESLETLEESEEKSTKSSESSAVKLSALSAFDLSGSFEENDTSNYDEVDYPEDDALYRELLGSGAAEVAEETEEDTTTTEEPTAVITKKPRSKTVERHQRMMKEHLANLERIRESKPKTTPQPKLEKVEVAAVIDEGVELKSSLKSAEVIDYESESEEKTTLKATKATTTTKATRRPTTKLRTVATTTSTKATTLKPTTTTTQLPKPIWADRGRDYHVFCCYWADKGACQKNADFMRTMCQKSCGTIGCTAEDAADCEVSLDTDGCRWLEPGQAPNPAPRIPRIGRALPEASAESLLDRLRRHNDLLEEQEKALGTFRLANPQRHRRLLQLHLLKNNQDLSTEELNKLVDQFLGAVPKNLPLADTKEDLMPKRK